MIGDLHHYRSLRLTLEATSAHAIHSGQGDLSHDVLLVRDANGLPTLPGSSLAGVLRHRYRELAGELACERLFGYAKRNDSCFSRLQVGWGLVHDSRNQPVEDLREDIESDPLLSLLADSKPLVRQRVRLNGCGSAASEGKFDTTLVPAGVRYTCLLGYWSDNSDQSLQDWQRLVDLLQNGLVLGHGTRTGAGRFRVERLYLGEWNLREPEQAEDYRQRPRSRTDTGGLKQLGPDTGNEQALHVTLKLQAEGGWRIGGGDVPLPNTEIDGPKDPDLLPMHEYRIVWTNDAATVGGQSHVLPASAVKGALRHRVAFHYRRFTGRFADQSEPRDADECPAVRQLFGYATADDAAPGLLHLHDLYFDSSETALLMHNRIDHFTGGVMNGALFSGQVLWNTPVVLTIELPETNRLPSVDIQVRKALQLTLEDLSAGWLPLGAAGSRGLGAFSCPNEPAPIWSDDGHWINGRDIQERSA